MVAQRRPTPGEVRLFEAVLVSLADHGFTPTAIAARLTYYSAPDSIQGAVAAGLLGGGSRGSSVSPRTPAHRSTTCCRRRRTTPLRGSDSQWDALALDIVNTHPNAKRFIPGLGHPVHKNGDPRVPVIFAIAEEEGVRGPHLRLFEAIGRVHPRGARTSTAPQWRRRRRSRPRRPRAAGHDAARSRCSPKPPGLVGQIAEEQRSPIGPAVYRTVDRNATYVPPTHPID